MLSPSIKPMAALTLCVIGYTGYLSFGGNLGREKLKAMAARHSVKVDYTLKSGDGGDCQEIGKWDAESRTCALTADLKRGSTILVADSGVSLIGNGHTMTGDGGEVAVSIIDAKFASVHGLNIRNYGVGVFLQRATFSHVNYNEITGMREHAIHLTGNSQFNSIVDNRLENAKMHGVALWSSHGNLIANNYIRSVRDGIRLQSSNGNIVTFNDVQDAEVEGVDLHLSVSNTIFLNSIHGSTAIPMLDDLGKNTFSLSNIGNYVSRRGSANSGCKSTLSAIFCDSTYTFVSGVDKRALAIPVDSLFSNR